MASKSSRAVYLVGCLAVVGLSFWGTLAALDYFEKSRVPRVPILVPATASTKLVGLTLGKPGDTHIGGTLFNDKGPPNSAEFEFSAQGGEYYLEIEYASNDSRPVDIFLNGRLWARGRANEATGGYGLANQRWKPEGQINLNEGKNTIRLATAGVFPYLRALRFTPVN